MANDLQTKIGEGISKLQSGFEVGKQKLQVTQELTKVRKEVEEYSARKTKSLLKLGQMAYEQVRKEQIEPAQLKMLKEELVEIDRILFDLSKQETELSLTNGGENHLICSSCQEENDIHDKFCGGCGATLEKPVRQETQQLRSCQTCTNDIPVSANFCPCCGMRTREEENVL